MTCDLTTFSTVFQSNQQGSWVRYPVWQHTFVSPSAFSRRAVVSYWRKYVHEVLVNRLGGLSLPRKSVVRLTDRPDMTLDVYRGRKTTIQPNTVKSKRWAADKKRLCVRNPVYGSDDFASRMQKEDKMYKHEESHSL